MYNMIVIFILNISCVSTVKQLQ